VGGSEESLGERQKKFTTEGTENTEGSEEEEEEGVRIQDPETYFFSGLCFLRASVVNQ
jgi:hypothetical protein